MGRRRWVLGAALALAVAGAGCGPARGPAGAVGTAQTPAADPPVVPVTKVTDGDTIHVSYLGRDERLRLIGIDTPEVDWYGGAAGCFGEEAGRYTRSRLDGATVRLTFDVNRRDRYGRLLAYVFLGTELFNLTLVQRGYAVADPVPPDTRMAAVFAGAEAQARAAGEGLWSSCPSPP